MPKTKFQPTPELIESYKAHLSQTHTLSTQKRKISSLRNFFSWQKNDGRIHENPLDSQQLQTLHELYGHFGHEPEEEVESFPAGKPGAGPAKFIKVALLSSGAAVTLVLAFLVSRSPSTAFLAIRSLAEAPLEAAKQAGRMVGLSGEAQGVQVTPSPSPSNQYSVDSNQQPSASPTTNYQLPTTESLTFQTSPLSDGDITLAPDGAGQVLIRSSTTSENSIDIRNANLTTGALIYGNVGNNGSNYDFLRFTNGIDEKLHFAVDANGNTFIGGQLDVLKNTNIGGELFAKGNITSAKNINAQNILTSGITRITSSGALDNITGYNQTSGNFTITQKAGDFAQITRKKASSSKDLLTLSLDESGVPSTIADTLVLERRAFPSDGYALFIKEGNARVDGTVTIRDSLTVQGNTISTGGNLSTTGNLTVDGNTTLGNSTSDSTTINGSATMNLPDNTDDALDVQQGTDNYINISTSDATPTVTLDLPVAGSSSTTANLFTSNVTKTINLGTGTAADTIAIGNTNASTTLALTGGDDWNLTGTGILTLSASATQTTAIVITDTDYTNSISIADNNITGTTANINLDNFDVAGSSGAVTIVGTGLAEGTNALAITLGAVTLTDGDLTISGGEISATTDDTTTTAFALNANTITTGNALTLSGTGMQTGEIIDLTGTWAPTDGTDNEAIDVNLTFTPTTTAATFRGVDLNVTEGVNALANTDYALKVTMDNSANTSTGVHSIYGGHFTAAGKTAGTTTAYGIYTTASGADTNWAAYFDGNITIATGFDFLAQGSGSDIGSSTTRFAFGYFDEVNATTLTGTLTGGDTNAATFRLNADNATADTEDSDYTFERGSTTPNAQIKWDSTNDEIDFNAGIHISDTITPVSSALLALDATGIGTTANGLIISQTSSGTITDAIDVSDETITNAINAGANTILGTTADINLDNFDVTGSSGAVTIAGTGLAEGTNALAITLGAVTLTDGDLTISGGEISATADDTTGTSFSFTGVNSTGDTLGITANSLTSGTALVLSSTATAFNGELLTLSKTGASGSTAFTSDIANITYSQTFNAAPGNSTGNVLDISRAITVDDGTAGAITGTVSGALATLSDNCTAGTADTCTSTANVLSLTQSYASSTGNVLSISNAGTGNALELAGAGTRAINSTSGDLPLKTTTSGNITLTTAAATGLVNVLTGNLKVGAGTPGVSLNGDDAYITGTLEVDGNAQFDGTTITATNVTAFNCTDCIDFDDLEDTLDLDAALTLNQTTNTWTQSFTGTTTTGLAYAANSITTGKGIDLTSTSNAIDSGVLFNISQSASAATDTSLSADTANFSFSPTYSTAVTTPSVTGQVLDISRSVTTNSLFASTLTLSGAVATFSDTATQTTGTLTSTADVVTITQNYTSNSGAALNITSAGATTAFALRVNDDGTLTDSTPFVVDNTGNVGIGTTGPSQTLHVVGQCVTGDSILITEDGRQIRIDEVKPGQKVYTLNQETGKLVPAQINALLDMGVKPVFKLTTKSGKEIRTTGNHPYLVNLKSQMSNVKSFVESSPIKDAGWMKVIDLKPGDEIAVAEEKLSSGGPGFFVGVEHNGNGQSKNGNSQNTNSISKFKSYHNSLISFVNHQLKNQQPNVANNPNGTINTLGLSSWEKNGATTNPPKNTWPALSNILAKRSNSSLENVKSIENYGITDHSTFQWDQIVSIEYTGEEQVYDIEVEGTHNFVAGHYINKNTGKALTQEQEKVYLEYLATKKSAFADFGDPTKVESDLAYHPKRNIAQTNLNVKSEKKRGVEVAGFAPAGPWMISQVPYSSTPTPQSLSQILGMDVNEKDIVYGGIIAHNTYVNSAATTGIALDIDANSLSSGSGLDISSTSTAAASNTQKGLNIALSGTNSTSAQTTYGAYISNTHAGTTSTNVGLYATATGGTTANYAGIFDAGNVGIGDIGPDNLLDILSTTAASGIAITSTGTDTDAYLKFELTDNTANFTLGVDDSVAGDPFKISTTGLGTSDMLTIDPRTTTPATWTTTLDTPTQTLASATNAWRGAFNVGAYTVNYTGTTTVTQQQISAIVNAATLAGDTATLQIDNAVGLYVAPPTEGTNVTIVDNVGIKVPAAVGSPTNNYGIYLVSQTTGTNDYGLYIQGSDTYALWVDAGTTRLDGTILGGDNWALGSADDSVALAINASSITTTAGQYGLLVNPTLSSAATSNGNGVQAQVKTAAASFTMSNAYTFYAQNASAGAGSTITNQYGIYVENQTTGGTADYGIYIAGADTYALWVDAGSARFDGDIIGYDETTSANSNFITTTAGSSTVFNDASEDIDFRIESDGNVNMFTLDAGENTIAFGSTTALNRMVRIAGTFAPASGTSLSGFMVEPTITVLAGADANMVQINGTITEAGSGVHALLAGLNIQAPTITSGVATVTDTSTLYIAAAPTATVSGANYALWSDAGTNRFDGDTGFGVNSAVPRTLVDMVDTTGDVLTLQNNSTTGGLWTTFMTGSGVGTLRGYLGFASQSGAASLLTAELANAMIIRSQAAIQFGTGGDNTRMTIDSANGNVGIGTTGPGALFDISASGDTIQRITHTATTGTSGVRFFETTTEQASVQFMGSAHATVARRNALEINNLTSAGGITFNLGITGPTADEKMRITSGGNVGIGTTGPIRKLNVYANDTGTNALVRIENAGTGDATLQWALTGVQHWTMGIDNSDSDKLKIDYSGDGVGDGINAMTFQNNGNVGIGTTAPGNPLHVFHTATALNTFDDVLKINSFITGGAAGGADAGFGPALVFYGSITGLGERNLGRIATVQDGNNISGMSFYTQTTADSLSEKMRISSQGNVGIGTTSPSTKLHLYQATGNTDLTIENAGAGNDPRVALKSGAQTWELINASSVTADPFYIYDRTNTTARLVILNDGNVGIGTTAPATVLDLGGGTDYTNTDSTYQFYSSSAKKIQVRDASQSVLNLVSDIDTNNGVLGAIAFTRSGGQGDAHRNVAGINAIQQSTGTLAGGQLQFWTKVIGSAGGLPRMVIDNAGNVGIGTSIPLVLLAVNGDAVIGSNAASGFQSSRLSVFNTSAGGGTVGLNLINNSSTANTAISLDFTPNVNISLARINALRTDTGGGGTTDFVFSNYRGAAPASLLETMRIKGDSGNVGIGTTGPTALLSVNEQHLFPTAGGSSVVFNETSADIDFRIESNDNGNMFTLDAGDNTITFGSGSALNRMVRIAGTFAPSSGTSLSGFMVEPTITALANADVPIIYAAGTITEAGSGVHAIEAGIYVQPTITNGTATTTTAAGIYIDTFAAATGTTNAAGLYIEAAPTAATNNYALWVDSGITRLDGNVGIGTTAPVGKLVVDAASAIVNVGDEARNLVLRSTDASSADLGPQMSFTGPGGGATTPYAFATIAGRKEGATAYAGYLQFATTAATSGAIAEAMRITSTGNVGIGTTGPNTLFSVVTNVAGLGTSINNLQTGDSTNYTTLRVATGAIASAGSFKLMRFMAAATTDTDGTEVGSVQMNINAVAYNTTSDKRLKENIQDSTKGLDTLMKLQVRNYNFISDPNKTTKQGFMAQELYEFYPEAVSVGGDDVTTNPWQVDYSKLTPLLTQSIQELNNKVENIVPSGFGKLLVKGNLEVTGDATVSGELSAQSIEAEEGRFGKIYADEIIARKGTFGDLLAQNISADSVTHADLEQVNSKLAELEGKVAAQSNPTTQTPPTIPTSIADIEELLRSVEVDEPLMNQSEDWLASQGETLEPINDSYMNILAINDLPTTNVLGNLATVGSFSVGSDLIISSTSEVSLVGGSDTSEVLSALNTLSAPLSIQSLAAQPLFIMGDRIQISTNGDVVFKNNVTIEGQLAVNEINPLPGKDLSISLANNSKLDANTSKSGFGNLLVKGVNGETVASIDASGSATLRKLIIASDNTATLPTVSEGEIASNATAGQAVLPANNMSLVIRTPQVNDNTLVYVTPTSSTGNQVLYVKAKVAGEYFIVGVDNPVNQDITFNYWIIDVRE